MTTNHQSGLEANTEISSLPTTTYVPTDVDKARLSHPFFFSIEAKLEPLFGGFSLDAFDGLDSNNTSFYTRYYRILHTFVDDMLELREEMHNASK